jgi:membrane associated rhomboid family serine protease
VGAAITQQLAWMWQISKQIDQLNLQNPGIDLTHGAFIEFYPYLDQFVTVGASGAIFGILLAFGMMFPNAELMLLFPPIPLKAKWLVIGYGLIELIAGVAGTTGDNVAHFAHLGGMLFGFILIMMWRHNRRVNF